MLAVGVVASFPVVTGRYSWTDWLGQAGLLADGIRTSRGVIVTAKDGHMCRSLLERQIDDFFFDNGIEHEIEPFIPSIRKSISMDIALTGGSRMAPSSRLSFHQQPGLHGQGRAQNQSRVASPNSYRDCYGDDLQDLLTIFAKWLPPESDRPQRVELPERPVRAIRRTKPDPEADGRVECEQLESTFRSA